MVVGRLKAIEEPCLSKWNTQTNVSDFIWKISNVVAETQLYVLSCLCQVTQLNDRQTNLTNHPTK